jgi:hypothetical protein
MGHSNAVAVRPFVPAKDFQHTKAFYAAICGTWRKRDRARGTICR